MVDKIFKVLLCTCIFFMGNVSIASNLSNIEIETIDKNGRIILDTDKKVIDKKLISSNEIQLKLRNTSVKDNLRTKYVNAPENTEVSVMQTKKDTYIHIYGQNIANFDLIYASDESLIPVKNGKKDFLTFFSIIAFLLTVSLISKNSSKNQNKSAFLQNEHSVNMETVKRQQTQIKELNTLRNKINYGSNTNSIHANTVPEFSRTGNNYVTLPKEFQTSNVKYLNSSNELKKAVNS